MNATYQRECVAPLWAEAMPLLEAHYREVAPFDDIALDPDVAGYQAAEHNGLVRCFTARVAGSLAGYAVFFVGPNMHYRQSLQARQDVFFVAVPYRASLIPWRLLRVAHRALQAEGVQVVAHHVKLAHPILGQLLARDGFTALETIHIKRLDHGL